MSITPEILKKSIMFAMKENLMIQFVYPDFAISNDLKAIIETVDHVKIATQLSNEDAQVIVINNIESIPTLMPKENISYILRVSKSTYFDNIKILVDNIYKFIRLNIVFTDIESFTEDDFLRYNQSLSLFADTLVTCGHKNMFPQINILTDRMMLKQMNNCNAGWESITLSPEGKFYICPAFYFDKLDSIGDLDNGLTILNPQLYKLDHAPLCRNCDAFQCKRCIWLNQKITREVNTPSHQQCVIAHIERNATCLYMEKAKHGGIIYDYDEIIETDYLDPLDVYDRYK